MHADILSEAKGYARESHLRLVVFRSISLATDLKREKGEMVRAVANTKLAERGGHNRSVAAPASSAGPSLHPMLRLQQQAGNQAVQEFLRTGVIQAKLAISQPSDPEEEEANQVADHVMRAQAGFPIDAPCSCAEGEEKCTECGQKSASIQRSADGQGMDTSGASGGPSAASISAMLSRGGGQPLDAATRAFFEPRFGRDFSTVRVHTDASAADSARSINALAYSAGEHLVFGKGQYAPHSVSGAHLLAHELTHVTQQRDGVLAAIRRQTAPPPQVTANRYPTDDAAWNDIQLYPVVESDLPHTDFSAPSTNHIFVGNYRIVPQLRNSADPHVLYYLAYNKHANRNEYAFGPEYLDSFQSHDVAYMVAAGSFFGFFGNPKRYEVKSTQVGYLALKGDLKGAISALGHSWVEALQDPSWWLLAIGATATVLRPGPPGTPPDVPPPQEPVAPGRPVTVRPFLSAQQIRNMRAQGVRVVTHRSFDADVVQNQPIIPQGTTNPTAPKVVYFGDGFRGFGYGPNCMIIEQDKVPDLRPSTVSPGQWTTTVDIPADSGFWSTIDEVEKALGGQ
jgi:hypothetical protein